MTTQQERQDSESAKPWWQRYDLRTDRIVGDVPTSMDQTLDDIDQSLAQLDALPRCPAGHAVRPDARRGDVCGADTWAQGQPRVEPFGPGQITPGRCMQILDYSPFLDPARQDVSGRWV